MIHIHDLKLVKKIDETSDIKTFVFEKPPVDWTEGTNVHVAFPGFEAYEKRYVRHLSLTSLPQEDELRFTTRLSHSAYKERLRQLKLGDSMLFFKFNARIPLEEDQPIILLSMGVGIAAYQTLAKTMFLKHRSNMVKSIHIAKEPLFEAEMKRMKIDHTVTHSRQTYYDLIEEYYDQTAIYYIVGSDDFLIDSIQKLKSFNHPLHQIRIDKKENKRQHFNI